MTYQQASTVSMPASWLGFRQVSLCSVKKKMCKTATAKKASQGQGSSREHSLFANMEWACKKAGMKLIYTDVNVTGTENWPCMPLCRDTVLVGYTSEKTRPLIITNRKAAYFITDHVCHREEGFILLTWCDTISGPRLRIYQPMSTLSPSTF